MFYLSCFFKTLFKNPLVSFFWVGSCAILVANTFAPEQIKTIAMGSGTIKKELPYFFALIPKSLNSNYVKRKLISLPGVQKIIKVSESKVNGHVEDILSENKIQLDESLMSLNFSGLKIYLSSTLKKSSRDLIRNYVARLAGESEVTLGALHKPENSTARSEFLVGKYFSVGLNCIAGFIFLICLLSFWKTLERASFVYEQFQRKSRVFEKSIAYAHLPLIIALAGGFFINPSVALMGLGFVTMGLLTAFILGTQFRTQ
jgi:hypothetical protein